MTGETIIFNGKWEARERLVSDLPDTLQWKLGTHRQHVAAATPLLEEMGFRLEDPTSICRGQPETRWQGPAGFYVWLLGYEHWHLYHSGRQVAGTRSTDNLRKLLERHLPQED